MFQLRCLAMLPLFLAANVAFSWGSDGHSLINRAATELMESDLRSCFRANHENLERLANVPDYLWKGPSTRVKEKPTHFFQWDNYLATDLGDRMPVLLPTALSLVGKNYIIENGSAVWRANQIYDLLVIELRAKRWKQSIQLAGVLGHYIGDLSMPMHLTSDYDGQSIGRRGIHHFFESTVVGRQDQTVLYRKVLAAASENIRAQHQQSTSLPIVSIAFAEGVKSLSYMPAVLDAFERNQEPADEVLLPQVVQMLANGSIALKQIWDKAALEQGTNAGCPNRAIAVEDPSWIPFDP